jgi:hypothetical protein
MHILYPLIHYLYLVKNSLGVVAAVNGVKILGYPLAHLNFGELVVLHTTPSMFSKFLVHA